MSTLGYRDHTLIGLPEQVANVIANHQSAGTLISMTAPRPISATDPRIRVAVRLVDTTTPAIRPVRVTSLRMHITDRVQPRRTRRRVAIAATIAAVFTVLVAAIAYLVGQLVTFLVEHAAIIAGLLTITALILAALRGTTGSGKRHCPGC
ncbi:hypothetical protein DKT69_23900 [Micromonospora sicca]|uniref:Uncharacterized protein n=1 Tax=Micromonospora sicca TaxID=2202420 RepID=A0A317DCW9_9ACTN|nr:hypothetical protein [Micromonospora sp. 4G51]PWR12487.1 hypothetical protein DKT69_23900 [Micromonospora sp. 4G51]